MSRLRFEGWEAEVVPAVGGRAFGVTIGGRRREVRLLEWEAGLLSFEVEGRVVAAAVEVRGGRVEVVLDGRRASFPFEEGAAGAAGGGGPGPLRAELPGRVLDVRVREGQAVGAGDVLLVIEAMKMEHALRAAGPARVGRVAVEAGDQIAPGEVLLDLLPPEGKPPPA